MQTVVMVGRDDVQVREMTKPTQSNRRRKMVSHTMDPSTITALRKKSIELDVKQSRLVETAVRKELGLPVAVKIRCA